jgi:hypothetical protein
MSFQYPHAHHKKYASGCRFYHHSGDCRIFIVPPIVTPLIMKKISSALHRRTAVEKYIIINKKHA